MYPHTRVLDSKTVEGHGTEAMAPSMRQEQAIWSPPGVVKTAMIAEELHYHGHLNLTQSIEEILQLKGVDVEHPQPQLTSMKSPSTM